MIADLSTMMRRVASARHARLPSRLAAARALSTSAVIAGATLALLATVATLTPAQSGGQIGVEEHGTASTTGRGTDTRLDCGYANKALPKTNYLMDVWGDDMAAPSGTLTIVEIGPSGNGTSVDYGPVTWTYSGHLKRTLATVPLATVVGNAVAHHDTVQKYGYHFQLNVQQVVAHQVTREQTTFWVDCPLLKTTGSGSTSSSSSPTSTWAGATGSAAGATGTGTHDPNVTSANTGVTHATSNTAPANGSGSSSPAAGVSAPGAEIPATGADVNFQLGFGLMLAGAGLLGLRATIRRPAER